MEKAVLHRLTTLCAICGVVFLILLGIMSLRDETREWKPYQTAYRDQLLGKISRDRNPALYQRVAGMSPAISQLVIDEWGAVDRCTTCHMGIEDPLFAGAKQPLAAHPRPELLKYHPVEKYGCTICHGGQGTATTYAGAAHKAIRHWPEPMVAKGLMQARCGVCHKDFAAIGADRLIRGREIYKEMHCAGCHLVDGQGGAVGPELSAFADKDPGAFTYDHLEGEHSKQNWVMEHFRNPQKVSPGSPMLLPAMNEDQLQCLASFVMSLSQRNLSKKYLPKVRPDFVPPRVDILTPEADLSGTEESE